MLMGKWAIFGQAGTTIIKRKRKLPIRMEKLKAYIQNGGGTERKEKK